MEMQNLTNYIREILDRMYPHGGLVVPHRTLRVEAHTGLHTMEVLIADIPYPPPFIHLFHLSHSDIVKVTPEPGHTPPRIIIVGKPRAINMAMTGRLLLSVQSSVMEMMRLQLGTLMPDTQRSNAYQILGLTWQLDIIMEQNHRLQSLILYKGGNKKNHGLFTITQNEAGNFPIFHLYLHRLKLSKTTLCTC
jgi:hypothetical protein